MDDQRDIEALIREVTEVVLARLGADRSSGDASRVILVLPVPTAGLERLARWCQDLSAGTTRVTVVAADAVMGEMERRGLKGRFGREVLSARGCDLGALADRPGGRDLVVVGGLGFRFARALAGLQDDDPCVWIVARALLAGHTVVMVTDDLTPSAGAHQAGAAAEAGRLLRELETLGLQPATGAALAERVDRWLQGSTTLVRSMGGLVSEADIERAAAEGQRGLRLPAGTLVTPLALSRAAELGIELTREDE